MHLVLGSRRFVFYYVRGPPERQEDFVEIRGLLHGAETQEAGLRRPLGLPRSTSFLIARSGKQIYRIQISRSTTIFQY